MNPDMIVRKSINADYLSIVKLHNDGLDEFMVNKGPGEWDNDLLNIDDTYHSNGGIFLVGCINNNVIAMGALLRKGALYAEIKRIRVNAQYRGMGYGQRILSELIMFSVRQEIDRLTLDTTDRQIPARTLFKKNGFVETHQEQGLHQTIIFFERKNENAQQGDAPEPAST